MKSLSRVWLFATPRTIAYQIPLSKGFSRQEYWSVLPFFLVERKTKLKWLSINREITHKIWLYWYVILFSHYNERSNSISAFVKKSLQINAQWNKLWQIAHICFAPILCPRCCSRLQYPIYFGNKQIKKKELTFKIYLCSYVLNWKNIKGSKEIVLLRNRKIGIVVRDQIKLCSCI